MLLAKLPIISTLRQIFDAICKYLKKFFSKVFGKKEIYQPLVESSFTETLEVNDYLVIATKPTEDDYVMIEEDGSVQEFSVQQLAQNCELMAKREVYNLAISEKNHPDTALAAQKRFENQGFEVHVLSSEEAQEKGIYLYALVNNKDPHAPITVLCRGTDLDASIIADLDPEGPGAAIMKQCREHMLTTLNGLCERFPNRKIMLTSHSLGGAISQTMTANLLEVVHAEDSTYPQLKNITGIDTVVFQSAGISKKLADEAEKHAKSIKSNKPNFQINFVAHVKKGDLVSRTGTYLFSNTDPDVVDVSLSLRALDKPILTIGDCLDIGFTVATTANPMIAAASLTKNLVSRAMKNSVAAHKDFFHHDAKDSELSAKSYGFLRNTNPEDRNAIKETFEEDMTNNRFLKGAQTALHGFAW
ncbi:MAG: hypothetical protein EBY16_01955 [Gammaproteobacteria bacterium]|nr:hypothetical protein [Gammaproteobacteria bacterium]